MGTARHLTRAPIREAIVDIQITPQVTLAQANEVANVLSRDYPKSSGIWQATFGLMVTPDGSDSTAGATKNQVGIRLEDGQQPYVLQCRTNGFSLSRLSPYQDWEHLKPEVRRLWDVYKDIVHPAQISRVAVRYINEMNLPVPFGDFKEYLETPPEVPTGLPQSLSGFFQRVVMVDHVGKRSAAVSQAFEGTQMSAVADSITVYLDIDVFSEVSFEASSMQIWDVLDGHRDFKNKIFFEHLTNKTLELFE